MQVLQLVATARIPRETASAFGLGRMAALLKPNGRVRGIVVGDFTRRWSSSRSFLTRLFLTRLFAPAQTEPPETLLKGLPQALGHSRWFLGGQHPHLLMRLAKGGGAAASARSSLSGGASPSQLDWPGKTKPRREQADQRGLKAEGGPAWSELTHQRGCGGSCALQGDLDGKHDKAAPLGSQQLRVGALLPAPGLAQGGPVNAAREGNRGSATTQPGCTLRGGRQRGRGGDGTGKRDRRWEAGVGAAEWRAYGTSATGAALQQVRQTVQQCCVMSNSKSRSEARLEQPKHMVAPRGHAEQQQQPRSLQILQKKYPQTHGCAGAGRRGWRTGAATEQPQTRGNPKRNKPAGSGGKEWQPTQTLSRIEIADPGRHSARGGQETGLTLAGQRSWCHPAKKAAARLIVETPGPPQGRASGRERGAPALKGLLVPHLPPHKLRPGGVEDARKAGKHWRRKPRSMAVREIVSKAHQRRRWWQWGQARLQQKGCAQPSRCQSEKTEQIDAGCTLPGWARHTAAPGFVRRGGEGNH